MCKFWYKQIKGKIKKKKCVTLLRYYVINAIAVDEGFIIASYHCNTQSNIYFNIEKCVSFILLGNKFIFVLKKI